MTARKRILKNILIVLIATFLFYLIGCYARILTGVQLAYIYLQYPLLTVVSIIHGPFVGVATGFIGHCLIDYHNSQHIWFSWAIGSGAYGFLIGFIFNRYIFSNHRSINHDATVKLRINYGLIIFAVNIVSFLLLAPTIEVLFFHGNLKATYIQGLFASISDGLISIILTDLFFSSFKHTIVRRIVAILTLLNSLVLVSYGNLNFGSIILYVLTILFGLYLFFYKKWHQRSKNKLVNIFKGIVFFSFITFMSVILFLALATYFNKPTGDENIAIVLGAGLNNEEPSKILQERLDTAYDWYMEDTSRILITSGGQGDDEIIAESIAMKNYLVKRGIPEKSILIENHSSTTEENFRFSLDVLRENGYTSDTPVICITNNFHCFRAVSYAKHEGFANIKSLPAPTPTFGIIPNYSRECVSLVKYLIKAM